MKFTRYKSIKKNIDVRFNFFTCLLVFTFLLISIRISYLILFDEENYQEKLNALTNNEVLGKSVPRGRILDRNLNVIVDNKEVKTIYYSKNSKITFKEEFELAKEMSEILDLDYELLSTYDLKDFFILMYPSVANSYIKKEEYEKYEERILDSNDLYNLKIDRISDDDLKVFSDLDKKAIYIYYLMNKGYYYEEKIIKEYASDMEYAYVSENAYRLNGFNTKLSWERYYPYGDVLRSVLGDISSSKTGLPYEKKDYYLSLGYSLDDRVGITGLEYTYESFLKGEKEIYEIDSNNSLNLKQEGTRGNDIVLTIDINVQKEIEELLKKELKKTRKETNTEYYDHSYVIIEDVKTGEVIALASKKMVDNKIYDHANSVSYETITPGSVLKAASMIVGYNTNVVKFGKTIYDKCLVFKNIKKCSWKTLGRVNDITAIKYSSNVYQYKTAISIFNKYKSSDAFDVYRDIYYQFGLGTITGIDLEGEIIGYSGNSNDLIQLMDLSIGQYDTYTPIQMSTYINTIANNGKRLRPHLLKKVYKGSNDNDLKEVLYEEEVVVLNDINTSSKNLNRVKKALKEVMTGGTGVSYISKKYNASGKTGTSESFLDINGDGLIDVKTYSKNFIGYAPSNNPKMSIFVSSPNVSSIKKGDYISSVNQRITKEATDIYFKYYK